MEIGKHLTLNRISTRNDLGRIQNCSNKIAKCFVQLSLIDEVLLDHFKHSVFSVSFPTGDTAREIQSKTQKHQPLNRLLVN